MGLFAISNYSLTARLLLNQERKTAISDPQGRTEKIKTIVSHLFRTLLIPFAALGDTVVAFLAIPLFFFYPKQHLSHTGVSLLLLLSTPFVMIAYLVSGHLHPVFASRRYQPQDNVLTKYQEWELLVDYLVENPNAAAANEQTLVILPNGEVKAMTLLESSFYKIASLKNSPEKSFSRYWTNPVNQERINYFLHYTMRLQPEVLERFSPESLCAFAQIYIEQAATRAVQATPEIAELDEDINKTLESLHPSNLGAKVIELLSPPPPPPKRLEPSTTDPADAIYSYMGNVVGGVGTALNGLCKSMELMNLNMQLLNLARRCPQVLNFSFESLVYFLKEEEGLEELKKLGKKVDRAIARIAPSLHLVETPYREKRMSVVGDAIPELPQVLLKVIEDYLPLVR